MCSDGLFDRFAKVNATGAVPIGTDCPMESSHQVGRTVPGSHNGFSVPLEIRVLYLHLDDFRRSDYAREDVVQVVTYSR